MNNPIADRVNAWRKAHGLTVKNEPPKLRRFTVQAFKSNLLTKKREPMRAVVVTEITPMRAAKLYARNQQIPDSEWALTTGPATGGARYLIRVTK